MKVLAFLALLTTNIKLLLDSPMIMTQNRANRNVIIFNWEDNNREIA